MQNIRSREVFPADRCGLHHSSQGKCWYPLVHPVSSLSFCDRYKQWLSLLRISVVLSMLEWKLTYKNDLLCHLCHCPEPHIEEDVNPNCVKYLRVINFTVCFVRFFCNFLY